MNEQEIERIARMAHATNRNWCREHGDFSQQRWHEAPEWQRQSAINGVKFILANPNAGSDALHNQWMAEKVADGWTYAPEKDVEAKKHPCLVPFEELPKFQQIKDCLFRATVLAIAGKLPAQLGRYGMTTIRPIKTEQDYGRVLARVDEIFDAEPGTAEGDELDVLATLIEVYENERFPIALPDPIAQ